MKKVGLKVVEMGLLILPCLYVVFWATHGLTKKKGPKAISYQMSWGHQGSNGVSAKRAQNLKKKPCGTNKVVIAVIDTGIDRAHPDLQKSLWVNKKEIPGNKKDDDGNGFVDDVHGWDFARKTGLLNDTNGHGTHIAGIIAASGTRNHGYRGVCPGAKIMSLRYYNQGASGLVNLKNSIAALRYAIFMKKKLKIKRMIINYSGGGAEFSKAEFKALRAAEKAGILLVAAAGNEYSNGDVKLYYPAAYGLSNIISVTAINKQGSILPSSNWGMRNVHVAAPGFNILSTLPGSNYGYLTGTSQATAFVSGIAAMLWSENPRLSYQKTITTILRSSVPNKSLLGKSRVAANANALSAIAMLQGRKTNLNVVKKKVNKKKDRKKASAKNKRRVSSWFRTRKF